MHIHESSEDYLEAILRLRETKGQVRSVDIAQLLDRSPETVGVGDHGGDGADLHHAAQDEFIPEQIDGGNVNGHSYEPGEDRGDGPHAVGKIRCPQGVMFGFL